MGYDRRKERMPFDSYKASAREKARNTGRAVKDMLDVYVQRRKNGTDMTRTTSILWGRIVAVLIALVIIGTFVGTRLARH